MLPALRGTRVPVSESLKLQSRAVGLHSRRTLLVGRALVAAQMAFCLLLLIVAGLVRPKPARALELGYRLRSSARAWRRVSTCASLGYSDDERQVALPPDYRARAGAARRAVGQPVAERPGHQLVADQRLQHRGIHSALRRAHVDERRVRHRGLLRDRRPEGVARPARSRPTDRVKGSKATLVNETMAQTVLARAGSRSASAGATTATLPAPDAFVIVGVVEDAKYRDLQDRRCRR